MNNKIMTLQGLYNDIRKAYDLSSDTLELSDIKYLIERYQGMDWKPYVKYTDKNYNKILLYRTNDFDVYIICWKSGQSTKIHDHPSLGCLMKVLHGTLEENLYKNNKININFICRNILQTDDIGYQINNGVIHEIIALNDSVSLHIYSPNNYQPKYYKYWKSKLIL